MPRLSAKDLQQDDAGALAQQAAAGGSEGAGPSASRHGGGKGEQPVPASERASAPRSPTTEQHGSGKQKRKRSEVARKVGKWGMQFHAAWESWGQYVLLLR